MVKSMKNKIAEIINQQESFFFENNFYLHSDPSRLKKLIVHYELYKKIKKIKGAVLECGVYKGSSFIQQLPKWKQIAASTAAEIGVESVVLAGSTSATDDNMIKMFNDLIWRYREINWTNGFVSFLSIFCFVSKKTWFFEREI